MEPMLSTHKEGDACDYGSYCGALLRCVENVCAPLAAVGENCVSDGSCGWGAYCDSSAKVCKAIEMVGEGQACDGQGVDCADGLFCKGLAVCVPYLEDGAPCEDTASGGTPCLRPAECHDGLCTLPTVETCE